MEWPAGALAAAEAGELGWLAAWPAEAERPPGGLRIDARAIDPRGEEALVSLVLAPPGVSLPFDDPAVSGALRRVLAGPPRPVLSTLLVDDTRFGGALTAVRGRGPASLDSDPFALLFPPRIVPVGPGLLGSMPAPAGPGIQRYGADEPWPWDRFSGLPPARPGGGAGPS